MSNKYICSLFLSIILINFSSAADTVCFFSHNITSNVNSGVFGPHLTDIETPCIVWFTTALSGYFRLDINNKIFASKKEKKSCLSEYVQIESGEEVIKLCHNNVTKAVEFFQFSGEAVVLIKWVGELDPSTSYLGRYNFEEREEFPDGVKDDMSAILSETISRKLDTYMLQRGQERTPEDIARFQYKSSSECEESEGILCKHSRFCADLQADTTCNSSIYLCIPSSFACDGVNNCLEGDLSDETGCYLPYFLFSTGGVVLCITLAGSVACFIQHLKVMSRNDMVRFNNDLVRRKDKVKARKADMYSNKPFEASTNPAKARNAKAISPLRASSPVKGVSVGSPPNTKRPAAPSRQSPVKLVPAVTEAAAVVNGSKQMNSLHSNEIFPAKCENEKKAVQDSEVVVSNHDTEKSLHTGSFPRSTHKSADGKQVEDKQGKRKVLADEKEILREIRRESSHTEKFYHRTSCQEIMSTDSEAEGFGEKDIELERLYGITPIRGPMIRNNGSLSLRSSKSQEVLRDRNCVAGEDGKTGYGYRFDFRSSTEFDFSESVYI